MALLWLTTQVISFCVPWAGSTDVSGDKIKKKSSSISVKAPINLNQVIYGINSIQSQ